jgi:tetratricopeptide (TPR) repeat protein
MAQKYNNFERFWQELKRRKTVRVIVSYAATAFILLQLTDILTPALLLPAWTTRFVTLLLLIGFPVAIIFTWVFDVTPQGIKKTKSAPDVKSQSVNKPSLAAKRRLMAENIIVAILIVLVVILAYPRIFGSNESRLIKDPDGKISIAVNTFDNLTGDTILNSWELGISELLIYNLGTSEELAVQNSQTMLEVYKSIERTQTASMAPSLSREAAVKLKAGHYITGNFQKTGNKIRIIAKLIDTGSDELLWTGKVDGDINSDYITLADSLSGQLKNFLEIKALKKNTDLDFREAFTNSAEAYRKYNEGTKAFMNEDYPRAIELFQEAFRIDTTFALAAFYIANANNILATYNSNEDYTNQAVKWTLKAYEIKEKLPDDYQKWVEMWRAWYITRNSNDVLKYCALLEKSDIKSRYYWYDIAVTYSSSFKMWEKAVNAFEKIETISSEWGEDWKFGNYFRYYGSACHQLGNHDKEAEIYEKGLKYFPDDGWLIFVQAVCATSKGDTANSRVLINKLFRLGKDQGASESTLEYWLANLYEEANSLDKAEEHYRNALKLNPGGTNSMNNLGGFLIKYDRGIDEGMNLVNDALKINPDYYFYLWNKGLGYYKQGKYQDALKILQQAKNNTSAINFELDKDIQNAKDAINRQF